MSYRPMSALGYDSVFTAPYRRDLERRSRARDAYHNTRRRSRRTLNASRHAYATGTEAAPTCGSAQRLRFHAPFSWFLSLTRPGC